MEKQECVSLALLSSYKIFNAKVNIAKILKSSNKVQVFFPPILKKFVVSRQILIKVPNKFHENSSRGSSPDTCG
jgi:hypothetical protein